MDIRGIADFATSVLAAFCYNYFIMSRLLYLYKQINVKWGVSCWIHLLTGLVPGFFRSLGKKSWLLDRQTFFCFQSLAKLSACWLEPCLLHINIRINGLSRKVTKWKFMCRWLSWNGITVRSTQVKKTKMLTKQRRASRKVKKKTLLLNMSHENISASLRFSLIWI